MPLHFFWKFPGFLFLTALLLSGCGVSNQDLKQEFQDEMNGTKEQISRMEKSYQANQSMKYSSPDSSQWNNTDWTLWMDSQGGGR